MGLRDDRIMRMHSGCAGRYTITVSGGDARAQRDTCRNRPVTDAVFAPLETSTDPYLDAGALLDGVCFEFLLSLNAQVWTWTTPAELSAFYDRVDASEVCSGLVERRDFDFSQGALVGTVSTATGCDAAHRVVDVIRDDSARTQTLLVQLEVKPGCPYELVQPFLVAVPDLPDGYTLQIEVSGPVMTAEH